MIDGIVRTEDLNLHLRSGESALHILKSINFAIQPGEVVSVVGPSGSGKTSLLMVLGGLERATDGVVMVGGTNLAGSTRIASPMCGARMSAFSSRTFTSFPR